MFIILLCVDLLVFEIEVHRAADSIDEVREFNSSFILFVVFKEMFSFMLSFKVFFKD